MTHTFNGCFYTLTGTQLGNHESIDQTKHISDLMILKIDDTTLLFRKFKDDFTTVPSVDDYLRKRLINYALFNDIIIELSKPHLADHHLVPLYLDHAIASMSNTTTFDFCFF